MAKRSKSSIAAIKRHRTAQLAKLVTRSYYLHRRKRDVEMSTLICEEFVRFGGVYIKFLQGVMLQSSLVQKWQNPDKLKIFENVDIEPLDVMGILRSELPPQKLAELREIQPQPFAAGSFGQVYFARHANGKPVIIKILRPMVQELLKFDLRLLSNFSRSFFVHLNKNMEANIDDALNEFRAATLRETDYKTEAAFAAELYQAYKGHPTFIIPETFLDLCTEHIIVQEYVEGISAAQLIKLAGQGVDLKTYVKETLDSDLDQQLFTLGYESLNGVFNLARIQGDPHPGNVRLLTNNRVGLIDFGISAHPPEDITALYGLIEQWDRLYSGGQNVANLFEQFIRFFVSDLYRALEKLAQINPDKLSGDNFTREVGQVAQETFRRVTGSDDIEPLLKSGKILQIINKSVNKGNRFGLVMKIEASEILRASQTYITLVEALGRRDVVLPQVFRAVVEQVPKDHPEVLHTTENSLTIAEALDTVTNWLERVAQRDPILFRQLMSRIKLKTGRYKETSHV